MNVALIYVEDDLWAFGMRSISAVLKNTGHNTRLILVPEGQGEYSSFVAEGLRELVAESDVVGVSSFSRGAVRTKQILESLRPLDKTMVWGGVHATINPEDCVGHAAMVCRGEGEGFMLELLQKKHDFVNWKDIKNGAYRSNGHIVINEMRPLLRDLDQLPLPDFSFHDEFHLRKEKFVRVDRFPREYDRIMYTGSRGCANNCSYCANAKLKQLHRGMGRFDRKISPLKYVENAVTLKKTFPEKKYFYFIDEDFLSRDVEQIRVFSEAYKEGVSLPFECMASPSQITEEKINLLKDAGLFQLYVGVESGSDRTKKEIYHRHMPNAAVLKAATVLNRYGVIAHYYFIIGNPYETREDLIDTVSLIQQLPHPFLTRMYNLVFIPGTILYENALKTGIISSEDDSGIELDQMGGLRVGDRTWKKKNLYLNGIIFMMSGKSTRFRIGIVPRFLINIVLLRSIIDFNDKHPGLVRAVIEFRLAWLKWRWHLKSFLGILRSPSLINLRKLAKR